MIYNFRELGSANERQSELLASVCVEGGFGSVLGFCRSLGKVGYPFFLHSGTKSMDSTRGLVHDGPPLFAQILVSRPASFLRKMLFFSLLLWSIFGDFLCTFRLRAE